jgi:hypothetical protein
MSDEIGFVEMTQNSLLECKYNDSNNYWIVKQTITQRRKVTSESEWEEKVIEMKSQARNIDVAMAQVFLSMEGYMITRNHDLFTEPEQFEDTIESSDGTVVH